MFLKSLEIFGFKSFADRTRIEFADGITALLGPNGCGKSNVVDAVKWVLGEQAAKTMRAEKMEDIIFNGTESRKALSVAEVTLTIANDNGLLPLDVSEITIKRRLYRSGESEYFINGASVKLKDIRELFWDTGVGKTAYSVMEQGKIDQILSSKPEDRRYLFEEAAGITRFKVKRAEAERKLERTEENMRQIESILAEVKRSYDTLKIQAEKTIKYRTLREEVFYFELDIQLLRLRGITQDRDRRADEVQKTVSRRDSILAEKNEIDRFLQENMDAVNDLEKQIAESNNQLVGLMVERREKGERAKELAEQQKSTKAKISQLEGRRYAIEEKIESLQEDIGEQEAAVHELNGRIADIKKNIASFTENITHTESRIGENDRQAAKSAQEIEDLDRAREQLETELEAITEDIVTELDSKLRDAGYSSQAHGRAEQAVAELLGQLKVVASGRKNIFSDFASVVSPSEDETRRFADNAVSSFTEIESLLGKLEETITEYKRSSPGFIDEFLSPEGIITKKRSLDQGIQENRNRIAEKREYINSLRSENSALVVKLGEYRKTLEELNLNRVQMEAQIQSAEVQLRLIRRELTGQETSLRDLDNELYAENSRLEEITDRVHTIESEIAVLEHKGNTLARELEKLDQDIASRNSHVGEKQKKLRDKNTEMEKVQGQLEKYHMDLAMAETEIRNIKENFKDTHSRDLMEFEERMFTIAVPAGELREKLAAARQEVKELGNVNFMAPEEFAETKERYDRLSAQIADTLKARDDLRRIADEIRAESTELFLTTYNRIRKNFHNMFRRLFGGGRGELRLTDPQSVLESGVDIFAQPPGKKLENISLLSGGEKTMTAVALLFATYMVRPSPFCLLDEIDAALDEQNVTRFIHTLREFANVSQYIVITHNKKTVAGAGTMLGVTMEESGITKVITIRLENESGIVAIPDPEPFEEEDVAPEENVYIPPHPPRRHQLKETEPEDFVAAETDTEAEVKSETEESAPTETEGETTEES